MELRRASLLVSLENVLRKVLVEKLCEGKNKKGLISQQKLIDKLRKLIDGLRKKISELTEEVALWKKRTAGYRKVARERRMREREIKRRVTRLWLNDEPDTWKKREVEILKFGDWLLATYPPPDAAKKLKGVPFRERFTEPFKYLWKKIFPDGRKDE